MATTGEQFATHAVEALVHGIQSTNDALIDLARLRAIGAIRLRALIAAQGGRDSIPVAELVRWCDELEATSDNDLAE